MALQPKLSILTQEIIKDISALRNDEKSAVVFLQACVNTLASKFNLYHVAIFQVDQQKQFAVMSVASSEGGKRMIERKHKLDLSHKNRVEACITENTVYFTCEKDPAIMGSFYSRLSNDMADVSIPPFQFYENFGFFESPDFGETAQRLLLPLRSSNGVIGAVDIHTSSQTIHRYDIEQWLPIADTIATSLMKIADETK